LTYFDSLGRSGPTAGQKMIGPKPPKTSPNRAFHTKKAWRTKTIVAKNRLRHKFCSTDPRMSEQMTTSFWDVWDG
jgi:hypothetical protein